MSTLIVYDMHLEECSEKKMRKLISNTNYIVARANFITEAYITQTSISSHKSIKS